jgi:hypothetical protein
LPTSDSAGESLEEALGTAAGEAVLAWATANDRRIEVDHCLYGHSSARVAAVYLQDKSGTPERKIIIKAFSTKSARDNEANRHRAARREAPEFARRHLVDLEFDSIPCGDDGIVMFQELAKGGLQEHAPLQSLIGTPLVGIAAGKICDSLLTEWNETGTRPEAVSLADMMNQHLGVRIEPNGKLWAWANNVPELLREPVAWLKIMGETLPNPLAFALSPRLSGSVRLRVQRGKVHGDLHANNIVCASPSDDQSYQYRLIDLASYSSDLPLAWDQASLLMSIVRQWLGEITNPVLTRRLLHLLTGEGNSSELPPALCQAVATIRTTGDLWAQGHGQLEEWRTQFQAAEVSSALILTGRSTLTSDQRWWFFHLAARRLGALLTRLGVHEPATPFEIDDDTITKLSPRPVEADAPRRRLVWTGLTPAALVKPRPAWTQRQQFANTVNSLRFAATDDEFIRLARANLSVAFGGLRGGVEATPSEVVSGLILVDTTDPHGKPLRVAVQFADLGRSGDWFTSHAVESTRRIRQFQRSGLAADYYLFVHNRDHRDEQYNAAVLEVLDSLTTLGDVSWTGLWSYRDLVRHVWQAVYEQCDVVIANYTVRAAVVLSGLVHHDPITEIPFRRYQATFSNRGLETISDQSDALSDPVPELVAHSKGIHLVVGEFGFGKTTVAVRASRSSSRRVLLLPGSRLSSDKAYLLEILSVVLQQADQDTDDQGDPIQKLWREISPRCLEVMLRAPQDDMLLIVDGLDEAPMAQRRSGLLDFLQALRKINVPVLVSVRTEFWNSRRDEVRSAMPAPNAVLQHITTTELRPWTTECMLALVDRSLQLDGPNPDLGDFRRLIEDRRYSELYGDIPCRPLFLDMLIDDVRQVGVRPRSRLELMTGWIDRKIERDWRNPKTTGGAIRPPIRGDHTENLDRTKNRAYRLMAAAARKMILPEETGGLALLPTVRIDDVLDDGPAWFADVDPEALAVQSVLLPIEERALGNVLLFRFAHQAFQEYFLAYSLHQTSDSAIEAAAPDEVREWLLAMRSAFLR